MDASLDALPNWCVGLYPGDGFSESKLIIRVGMTRPEAEVFYHRYILVHLAPELASCLYLTIFLLP